MTRSPVSGTVDLLRFVRRVADDPAARDRFRADPDGVLAADVGDHEEVTGEDVEAVAAALDRDLRLTGTVRPIGGETPRDAARRALVELCELLDGPAVSPVTLPHREVPPDPPPPPETARGGGEPVPTEPPGGRWLHPVIPDDED